MGKWNGWKELRIGSRSGVNTLFFLFLSLIYYLLNIFFFSSFIVHHSRNHETILHIQFRLSITTSSVIPFVIRQRDTAANSDNKNWNVGRWGYIFNRLSYHVSLFSGINCDPSSFSDSCHSLEETTESGRTQWHGFGIGCSVRKDSREREGNDERGWCSI
ncbi:hypothetical protein DFH27DRAFT_19811 [Peziza echinospora]|nr:hypothetical protein DFH27DRAFT_19811 [Peziza echinospora]